VPHLREREREVGGGREGRRGGKGGRGREGEKEINIS